MGLIERGPGWRKARGALRIAPGQAGLLQMLAFWCVVMGLLYAAMSYYLQPRQPQVRANGDLVLARAADGHFYVPGEINGQPLNFLVDTGASLVTVSDAFADKAGLQGGVPTTFRTANGDRAGRVVHGVTVRAGPAEVTSVAVGVGLHGGSQADALLGQSFLSKFDVSISKDQLVLHPRR
jgi:aspartyl protease family protein